jgi:ribosome maturation factor RimP
MLQPLIEDLGYEFVGLEYNSSPKHGVVRIYIDRAGGVDLDDCTRVSHEVAALLDVEDPISGHYKLEISSPGLDRPLFTPEHFTRYAGERARVSLFAPVQGRRNFKGRILRADPETLILEQDGAEVTLSFNNIARARLMPDYDALMSGRDRGQAGQGSFPEGSG